MAVGRSGGGDGHPASETASGATGGVALDPALSARGGLVLWQRRSLLALPIAGLSVLVLAPDAAGRIAALTLTAIFATLAALRFAAVAVTLANPAPPLPAVAVGADDMTRNMVGPQHAELPVYTVLVALYDEAAVAADLVASLTALDYPADRLDVLILLEADDAVTLEALRAATPPAHLRLLVLPDGAPRTKPRALGVGLAHARGDYVVVFDAEDRPEPDQLRRALAAFAARGPDLGCVQARLAIYNAHDGPIATQFAIEYTALFDGLLPALVALGAPIPLGGTSNHFPRRVLDRCGGWDPWNVTEDADLGLRLARHGYRVAMLGSTTWEEAPHTIGAWLAQRTRWQKGWMQTYAVHMRDPRQLRQEVGVAGVLWVQVLLGGGVLAALLHPWLVAALVIDLMRGRGLTPLSETGFDGWLWTASAVTLALAVAGTIALALLTLHRRGRFDLMAAAVLAPLMWLPVSLAAYRALWELQRRPFHWAKTPHGVGLDRRRRPPVEAVATATNGPSGRRGPDDPLGRPQQP